MSAKSALSLMVVADNSGSYLVQGRYVLFFNDLKQIKIYSHLCTILTHTHINYVYL